MKNIYNEPAAQPLVARLKQQLYALKKEMKDEDQFADEQPKESSYVQAPTPKKR